MLLSDDDFFIKTKNESSEWIHLKEIEIINKFCIQNALDRLLEELSPKNIGKNIETLLEEQLELNNEEAPFQLGQIMFEKGDMKEAFKYFRLSSNYFIDPRGTYQLAVMLYNRLFDSEDALHYPYPDRTAISLMESLLYIPTDEGSPIGNKELCNAAAFNLSLAYQQGQGVMQSNEKELYYLKYAVSKGTTEPSILAQSALGHYFCFEEHLDIKSAFYWHSEASANGNNNSKAALGVMYLYGLGVKNDWCLALKFLKDAAKNGNIYARGTISYLYYKRKLFTIAAESACSLALDENAKLQIGKTREFERYAKRGIAIACFIYARCLDVGLGITHDETIASIMYSKCFEMDPELCSRYHDMVIRKEL